MRVKTGTAASLRRAIAGAQTIVVKIGTKVLVHEDGSVAAAVVADIAESIAALRREGRKVLMVSSGAVGIGAGCLNVPSGMVAVCAAAGQSVLTALYHEAFGKTGIAVAQLLVTDDDFKDSKRRAKLRATLRDLLQLAVVPIVNENDVVAHFPERELAARLLTDNDMLAAFMAEDIEADLLVVLTDVDGVYTSNPNEADALLISQMTGSVHVFSAPEQVSDRGRGGMQAKLQAAHRAVKGNGLLAVIANGRTPNVLGRIMNGHPIGTLIAGKEDQ